MNRGVLARLVLAEARSYGSLLPWVRRRPDVPAGTAGFRYVGAVLPVLWTFIVLSAVEVVVVHLVLPWPAVRLVLDVAGIWGVLFMLGLTASLTVKPHLVGETGLRVRHGVTVDVLVPWEAVAAVTHRERGREKSRAVQLDHTDDGDVVSVVIGNRTNVDVALREPLVLRLPDGPRTVTAVRLAADDPRALVRAARQRVAGVDRPAG